MRMARIMKYFSLLLLVLVAASVTASDRLVMVRVKQTSPAWNDSRIYEKLATVLTRDPNLQVRPAEPIRGRDSACPT